MSYFSRQREKVPDVERLAIQKMGALADYQVACLEKLGFRAPFIGNIAVRDETGETDFWMSRPSQHQEVALLVAHFRADNYGYNKPIIDFNHGWSYGVLSVKELVGKPEPVAVILEAGQFIETKYGSQGSLQSTIEALTEYVLPTEITYRPERVQAPEQTIFN